jgi:hypothetical protein
MTVAMNSTGQAGDEALADAYTNRTNVEHDNYSCDAEEHVLARSSGSNAILLCAHARASATLAGSKSGRAATLAGSRRIPAAR